MEFIKRFNQISLKDIANVGGKTASLGEMFNEFSQKDINIPNGFAITSQAYFHFIKDNNLEDLIIDLFKDSKNLSKEVLSLRAEKIRMSMINATIPKNLQEDIIKAYRKLKSEATGNLSVAVRSSATAEDLPEASFAGQQESYLNIYTEAELIEKCRYCFASLYTERAVSYRQDQNIPQSKIALSICVQKMVRSDLASSGVIFTLETESGFEDTIIINSSWGLGENIVKGVVNPDEYIVFKPTMKKGYRPILKKIIGGKEFKMIYNKSSGETVKNIPTSKKEKEAICLTDDEILKLSEWAIIIEEHYSKLKNSHCPMDIEWGKDGLTNELYILQARPETVHSQLNKSKIDVYKLNANAKVLLTGNSVGHRIGQGKVRVIHSSEDLKKFQEGEVLVAEKTEPDWEPYLKASAAIITDRGGRTCHAAIVSRELQIPAVVGTLEGTKKLLTGQEVTVSCINGDKCFVYEGLVPFEHEEIYIDNLQKTHTKMMMNIANPSAAFKSSFIPNDGVGLARMEFIINNTIKIHPMALISPEKINNKQALKEIEQLTVGYSDKKNYFVDNLASGISIITAAFYPKDVIIRLSDFKSNEYQHLLGGESFEMVEENPMIGFRGAFRYYHERYKEAFALECQAILKVREEMGLKNLKIMVPFCRTLTEAKKIIEELAIHGLDRKLSNLEIYMMCEIPSNAILAEEFSEIFDGLSIGSNDLTQLTLGVDRDSEILSPLFNEDDPAVLKMIELAIDGAHKKGIKIGLCGQRASDDPEFARFLVNLNIDSISLNPDALMEVTQVVRDIESEEIENFLLKEKLIYNDSPLYPS
jgi:pyruvate,water dikinase